MKNYSIRQFQADFPSDAACLDYILNKKFPNEKGWYRVKGRKCYANSKGEQIHPLKGTIFEKSDTPLTSWFYAIFLFSQSKNGISAKELQRQIGTTYKTAWRMATSIRSLMAGNKNPLKGVVEVDETYIGGVRRLDSKFKDRVSVVGMVERKGRVKSVVLPYKETHYVLNAIKDNIQKGSRLMTDEFSAYKKVKKLGYKRSAINHSKQSYVSGDIHTNTIEGFWGQFKRSLNGTYHAVSKEYLQTYLDEFAFRYNHRNASVFEAVMARI